MDPSLRPVVVGVLAFSRTKVGRHVNLDVILICFFVFFKMIYIHKSDT